MKNLVKTLALGSIIFLMMACASKKDQSSTNMQGPKGQQEGPPNSSKILEEMDANKDGKIAEIEAKGPLKDDFSKIDSNGDGFISKEELQKGTKPKRSRPQRR